jgi:hypothetical protein
MADYKETTINGTAWQRAQLIIMSNHLGQLPTVTYQEESILALADGNIQRPVGQLSYTIDPLAEIELVDVETLLPTGETIPVALVHQALFSDYINRAKARDEATVNQPTE